MAERELDAEILLAAKIWQQRPQGPSTYEEWHAETAELFPDHEIPDDTDPLAMGYLMRDRFWWHWADTGFTTFTASHSYAAALMASDPSMQQGDLMVPWRCVRVLVPDGLLETDNVAARLIYVIANFDGNAAALGYTERRFDPTRHAGEDRFRWRVGKTLADVLWHRTTEEYQWLDGDPAFDDEKQRVMLLCCNYVAGLFYTLQHTRDWKAREHRNHFGWRAAGAGRRPPPTHRNVVLGRPIAVNLSAEVQQLARGASRRSAPAMFQSLVRGHYKRQVIGVGRSGRKVIWLEPYWRGPEGAPLLARPYHFVSEQR